jgi:hypothetical protein
MEEPLAMARLGRVSAWFPNQPSEVNHHTVEASTRRASGVLAGRRVLYPPHHTIDG